MLLIHFGDASQPSLEGSPIQHNFPSIMSAAVRVCTARVDRWPLFPLRGRPYCLKFPYPHPPLDR